MAETDLILTYRGVVYPWHCDQMGHMNVMWYVGKFDEATWQVFHHIGLTPTFLRDQGRGMAAVRQEISYRRELIAGDVITIRSTVLEMRERVMRFYHEMWNDERDQIAATTILTGVYLDTNSRQATTFPDEIVARAKQMITGYVPVQ